MSKTFTVKLKTTFPVAFISEKTKEGVTVTLHPVVEAEKLIVEGKKPYLLQSDVTFEVGLPHPDIQLIDGMINHLMEEKQKLEEEKRNETNSR